MKNLYDLLSRMISHEAIEDLIQANTILEDRISLFEKKDAQIKKLLERNRSLEAELAEVSEHINELEERFRIVEEESFRGGIEAVIGDIVHEVSRYDRVSNKSRVKKKDNMPINRIIHLLEKRYGLEVIEGTPMAIDPEMHHVVDVVSGCNGELAVGKPSVEQVSRGYKIRGKVLKPLQLRLVDNDENSAESCVHGNKTPGTAKKPLVVLKGGKSSPHGPGGAA
jgi:molecular chaperone GrpE (heat shock protein)